MTNLKQLVKLILTAQTTKLSGELGAILGQHEVNIVQFCNEFNKLSDLYEPNLPVRVFVFIFENNTFKIKIKGPVTGFLIKIFSSNKVIDIVDIYKIALIQKKENSNKSLKEICKNLFSTTYSMNFLIKYE